MVAGALVLCHFVAQKLQQKIRTLLHDKESKHTENLTLERQTMSNTRRQELVHMSRAMKKKKEKKITLVHKETNHTKLHSRKKKINKHSMQARISLSVMCKEKYIIKNHQSVEVRSVQRENKGAL